MEKGALVGKGMTAEVYEWGQDKVVKLYFDRISDAWIQSEAEIGHAIYKEGLPAPEVFDTVISNGRRGIVFEKIDGRSMMRILETEPWNMASFLLQLSQLQYSIHQHKVDILPSQKEKFGKAIHRSSEILGDRESEILDYIGSLPDGTCVCHGDLHVNNIIMTGKGPVVIDWANAYKGNPLGDVARSNTMISTPVLSTGIPSVMSLVTQYTKTLTSWTYLNAYMSISKAKYEDIDAWMLPAAAVRLRDKMPGQEKWLLGIIDDRLLKLKKGKQ